MTDLQHSTETVYDRLRAAHPHFTEYLELMHPVVPTFGGLFYVADAFYTTQKAAEEARNGLILFELMRIEGVGR